MANVPRWYMARQAPRGCRAVGAARRAAHTCDVLRGCRPCARGTTPYCAVRFFHPCLFLFSLFVWKLNPRPSVLDEHTRLKMSSSLYLSPGNRLQGKGKDGLPFGCHIFLPGFEGDELARLVFSGTRSPLFPNSDELVAFWYDSRHSDYDEVDLASLPMV